MKILLFIEGLGSGGAERQIVLLALLLKKRGYHVEFLTFVKENFYSKTLVSNGISLTTLNLPNRFIRTVNLIKEIKRISPQIVISFLDGPNMVAELATLPKKEWKLIVSERTGKIGKITRRDRIRFQLHRFADKVVSNSYNLTDYIITNAPWLSKKTTTIVNTVNFNVFNPIGRKISDSEVLNITIAATFNEIKNPSNLIKALAILKKDIGTLPFKVYWYGNKLLQNEKAQYGSVYLKSVDLINEYNLTEDIYLFDTVTNIHEKFLISDAICLPSFYEGCPNVICEAMSCGIPVLASNVCDNPRLISSGINGFLFDPHDIYSIKKALLDFVSLNQDERNKMGENNYNFALKEFNEDNFVESYINLF